MANRTWGIRERIKRAAFRKYFRLCVTSCVREPGRIVTSGRWRVAMLFQECRIELLPPHLVEKGMADERGVAAALANQRASNGRLHSTWSTKRRIFLIRQLAQAQICGGA